MEGRKLNNKVVSVLIPAYNVERYLPKCLDSVLCQTFKDFEIILIDDGSTDKTGEICEDYRKKDFRVKVYHQENRGISATRELCLQKACGEFIQFVDSDDWIEPNMLEILVKVANDTKSDIVAFDFRTHYFHKTEIVSLPCREIETFRRNCISSLWTVLWKNFIRMNLVKDNLIHFPVGIDGGEDYFVMSLLSLFAKRIAYVPQPFYNYNVMNLASTMSQTSQKKLMYQIDATKLFENRLSDLGLNKRYEKELLRRKFCAKLPLLKFSFSLWLKTFSESSWFFFWAPPVKWAGYVKSVIKMLLKKGKV